MIISLDETKNYLRLETDAEDDFLNRLIVTAESLCMDVARVDSKTFA